MSVAPIVRYMLLCEDWKLEGDNSRKITIVGLLWNIHSVAQPAFPLLYRELCVFLALTEGRGQGEAHISCVHDETGDVVIETRRRPVAFGTDPLEVVGVPFRIRNGVFRHPGRYSVQFWYDGVMIEDRPLKLR